MEKQQYALTAEEIELIELRRRDQEEMESFDIKNIRVGMTREEHAKAMAVISKTLRSLNR